MDTSIILGQGIAGSTLAWQLHWVGHAVHVVDRGELLSASRIAAGLITPVTGRRLAKSVDFDRCWTVAEEFYRRVEITTGSRLLEITPATRFFSDEMEREYFLKERATALREEVEFITESEGRIVGFRMLKAARLRVSDYLNVTRDYFAGLGQYHRADVNLTKDIVLHETGVRLLNPVIEGTRLFFCQGFQSDSNPWFPGIPDAPSRGEIIGVRIPGRSDQEVIHRGYWLAPASSSDSEGADHQYIVGATYDRENLKVTVTEHGREELQKALGHLTTDEAEITSHVAAIRAGMRQRQPISQVHSKYSQLAILNGLGSKGSLLAPEAAGNLIEIISGKASTIRQAQLKPRSLTKLAHSIVHRAIQPGDTVIDATVGNGHDTVFLARCTGASGRVIAIDIQESAIQSTRARLEAEGLSGVELAVADHGAELNRLAEKHSEVKAIMFNLGYLPGGDKHRTTESASTVQAISAGLRMLIPGGVITVVAYRGHLGGLQESQAVQDLADKQENSTSVSIDVIPGLDDNKESPVLYVFRSK